uniref:Neurotrypsin n=1 Tax=Paramormyrops kingsleyae TaxID=1676925 RepID=A0A3B3QH29_9TELE
MSASFLVAVIVLVFNGNRCYGSDPSSFILPFTDCIQSKGKAGYYQGSIDVTESGGKCMNWSEVAGIKDRYPGKGLGDHNFCRNPDGRIRPWCFVRNSRGRIDWGYCDCKQGKHQPATFVPVRLSGGGSGYEGRVEVYHAGQWGTVCDDQWDDADAEVVCRQLGFGGTAQAWGQAYYGEGSGKVLLDEVQCSGNELSIEQCPKRPWGEHNCEHREDAGVSCMPTADGSLRLVNGSAPHRGRLEVHYRGQWGTVCDDGVHPSGQQFGEGVGPILLDDISCTGKEPALVHCGRREWGKHDCTHSEDISISCSPQRLAHGIPPSLPLRLVGGENPKEGRVEVLIDGQWGTICDDGWTDQDADVVCRQLGYTGLAKARTMAYFGEGQGAIHVDNVKCTGAERSLGDCIKEPAGSHNCRHSEDAGVICDYGQSGNAATSQACGIRLVRPRQKRIIGGENSLRGGWPWQAAIRLRGSPGDGRLVCGATLVSSCWILTSAHCFKRYGNSTKTYKVRVGDYHILVPEEYETEYAVEEIIPHPSYEVHSNDYDLALVRLSGREGRCVTFSRHVLPACLPGRREKAARTSSSCYITGWGDTGRAYSKTLQQAAVSQLHKRHCEAHYPGQFTARMLCAGNTPSEPWVDSCRGDSGGPLVCERTGGRWVLYGVTSWGYSCRLQNSPGVYTKVSAFVPWIRRLTGL